MLENINKVRKLKNVTFSTFIEGSLGRIFGNNEWEKTLRILDVLDEYEVKATFFICGDITERHPDYIRNIFQRGHEIGSHGYHHQGYYDRDDDRNMVDLKKSLVAFSRLGVPISGFRPPYLASRKTVYGLAKRCGLSYISSCVNFSEYPYPNVVKEDKPFLPYSQGVTEVPITLPSDYDFLGISRKSIQESSRIWLEKVSDHSTLLFHSFRMGAKKNIKHFRGLVSTLASKYNFVTACKKAKGINGITLTIDIGLFTKKDLFYALFDKEDKDD